MSRTEQLNPSVCLVLESIALSREAAAPAALHVLAPAAGQVKSSSVVQTQVVQQPGNREVRKCAESGHR